MLAAREQELRRLEAELESHRQTLSEQAANCALAASVLST
jgi:hypothetical protein